MVRMAKVNRTEDFSFTKFVEQISDAGDGEDVELRLSVQRTIVNTHAKLARLLPNE